MAGDRHVSTTAIMWGESREESCEYRSRKQRSEEGEGNREVC